MSFTEDQEITVWNKASNDGFGGGSWSGPHVIKCRWAAKQEKATDTNGDEFISTHIVYSSNPLLRPDSKVYLGVSTETSPNSESNDIRALSYTPIFGEMRKGVM